MGHVDWIQKKAVASGQGFAPARIAEPERRRQFARRAAVLDARRNLLEVLEGVRLQGQTRLAEKTATQDIVRSQVEGLLPRSIIEAVEDMPDGSAQARVSVELRLIGLEVLLPPAPPAATPDSRIPGAVHAPIQLPPGATLAGNQSAPPASEGLTRNDTDGDTPFLAPEVRGLVRREDSAAPAQSATEPPSVQVPRIVVPAAPPAPEPIPEDLPTGIVVDARGAGFEPSLAPSLHDDAGELYPANLLTPEVISSEGIVRYYRDLFPAMSSKAAGDRPLVVKAQGLLPGRTDALLLTPEAASQLRGLTSRPYSPLPRGRVIIVF